MNWGFLGEFWDAITGATIDAWEYTADWFKQIGLAVAGAIGGLFDYLIHYFSDLFVFLGWLFSAIKELFLAILLPISFLTSFLKGFISNAIKEPIVPETEGFATSTLEIFETLPYWATLSQVLGFCVIFIIGIAIILTISKI